MSVVDLCVVTVCELASTPEAIVRVVSSVENISWVFIQTISFCYLLC